jgi:predicted transcriptional regulator
MAKYRNGLGIIADILNAAGSGAKKTRIMYVANLSHDLLEKYLRETVDIGFLRLNSEGYEVTGRGKAFLEKYADYSGKYSKLESELQSARFEREILERMCQPLSRDRNRGAVGRRGRVKKAC